MIITIDGPDTVVEINGVKVTDYTEGQPVPERKFDFEPQRGPRPDGRLYWSAEPQRQRCSVFQRSEHSAFTVVGRELEFIR